MTKKGIYIVFLFLFCSVAFSQNKSDSLSVNFYLEFNKLPLQLGKKYTSRNDTLSIETFKCYISNIKIQYEDRSIFIKKDSYHLLDSNNPKSFQIPLTQKNGKQISKIVFNIGIDSLANTSGAMDGDLDPVNGMYWAWQSGYINMKIEGKSSSCKTRKNEFQFHLGGYLHPYYAMRQMEIRMPKPKTQQNSIDIGIELNNFFSEIELYKMNSIMAPCKKSMELADLTVKLFTAK